MIPQMPSPQGILSASQKYSCEFHESVCLCTVYAHTYTKCNNSLISLDPREFPELAPGHPF